MHLKKKIPVSEFGAALNRIVGEIPSSVLEKYRCEILSSANDILNHTYYILGHVNIINPLIWNRDFNNNYTWRHDVPSNKIKIDTSISADVKYPWELSRFHHLLWLGEAYILTSDEKYAQEIISQIKSWNSCNDYNKGINWKCTMEVAIRMVNMIYSVAFIQSSPCISPQFINEFQDLVYKHAVYISKHLEYTVPYNANHYLSNIVALLYAGILFSNDKSANKWLKFSINEYFIEVRRQYLPCGANFENSISYHRLSTEIIISAFYLLKRNGYKLSLDIESIVSNALTYIIAYSKSSGAPLIGDNDDGRFLPFIRRDYREHEYMFDPNSLENIIIKSGILDEDTVPLRTPSNPYVTDSGIAIMKTNNSYLIVSNSEPSRYVEYQKNHIATHTHNDKLSFELTVNGTDVIVDPGTYVYTADAIKRNEFRSTLKHNTIVVDGEEQDFIANVNLFAVRRNHTVLRLEASGTNHSMTCKGAYRTIKGQLNHYRLFQLSESSLLITDELIKVGEHHKAISSFHLAPGFDVASKEENKFVIFSNTCTLMLEVELENEFDYLIEVDTVSPSYGVLLPSKTLRFISYFNNQTINRYKFIWD